jgi:MFS family permease
MTSRRDAFSPLRSRQYRRWFLSQILASSGTSTQAAGQGWLIIQLHGDGLALAAATGALFLPSLLFSPHFGALADRHDRRTILIITQCAMAALAGTTAALTATGIVTTGLLVVMAFAMGIAFAMDAPARQVYVMGLVGGENVASAISLNEVVLNASRAIGPAFGGVVISLTSVWCCFLFNAVSFLPTLAVLVLQRPAVPAPPRRADRARVREGLRYALSSPLIRACLLMAVTSGSVISVGVFVPLLATRVLHVGGAEYGVMLGAFGFGAVPGAMCAAASGPRPTGPEVRRLALTMGLVVVACASAPDFPLVLAGLAAVGATSIWFIARANALVLLSAEPHMRGRVVGVWSIALPGMNPVTGLIFGASADAWGPRIAYTGVGVVAALVAVAGWHALRARAGERAKPPSVRQEDFADTERGRYRSCGDRTSLAVA